MRIATWNLNHRVGTTRFRPEAVEAASSLPADIVVLTEYFPRNHHDAFLSALRDHGLVHCAMSEEVPERANRVLIAARNPVDVLDIPLPDYDLQFRANVLAVRDPNADLTVVGLRVPFYEGVHRPKLHLAWEWMEAVAATLVRKHAVIIGDLNVRLDSARGDGGDAFRRIMDSGWTRAAPSEGASYYHAAAPISEIDHCLLSPSCQCDNASYHTMMNGLSLAGSNDAISDHACLVVEVAVMSDGPP